MKRILYIIGCVTALSSCRIYSSYQRPDGLPTDSLFRDTTIVSTDDSLSFGDLPWENVFGDPQLQELIRYGLAHNTDMQTALLRLDEAKAQLLSAKLAFLPSLTLSPQGTLTSTDGSKNENAVTQARASLYELEATHNDLLRQQREAENSLCTLLGMTCRTVGRGKLSEQVFPETFQTGVLLRLLARRPDVVQAEMTLASAYYSVNQARSAFYPNLTLTGSAGWTNSLGQTITNPGGWILSAVASLTQPIFNRGKLISNLRVSKDEEQIALLGYKQTLLEAGQEVNDALYAVSSVRRTLDSHRKQCQELERSIVTAEALYRTGNATYLELLSARQALLSARLNVVTDGFTYCQSVISLYNALGGGAGGV